MKYTPQQADDLARQLKTTRKGRKFLKNLLNFHEQWLDFAKTQTENVIPVSNAAKKPAEFPDSLKFLAEELDSNFETSKNKK